GKGAATEASYFAASAPTVVFGPGVLSDENGPVAHGEREYVKIDDVRKASDILTQALGILVG
ncbi:MAG: succinyl-diaminopimelate desuccinylase, partial [Halodesulfurarchaeum sp.]|nr:succinyl-diaminopimelate desuccinylase [Halodesulfurarchaeum sp.]